MSTYTRRGPVWGDPRRTGSNGGEPRLVEKGHRRGAWALSFIGGFKLVKGLALVAVAVGAHHLLHRNIADFLAMWVAQLHLDPDNRYIGKAMARLLSLDPHQLRAVRDGTLVYAALLLTEGIGLLLRRRWAEYFTVIVTGSFIPIEVYELTRRLTWVRLVLLGVNVAVVWYLIAVLRRPESKRAS